jgi:hypothetical protein
MRKAIWLAAAAALVIFPATIRAQQADPQPGTTPAPAQDAAPSSATPAPAAQQDSVAAAARKTRDQKKEAPKSAKIFDNDNIPTTGGVSTVGAAPAEPGSDAANAANAAAPASPTASGGDEKAWRAKFASLHHKLEQDQAELDILQRELGVANVQYYSDPMKGMQQELTRDDIYKKTAAIDAKKKEIDADKQAITDAEDDLRKAGGDSGWAR